MNCKCLGIMFLCLMFILFLFSIFKNTKEFMTNSKSNCANHADWVTPDVFGSPDEYPSGPIPLPAGEMLMFADNVVSPECCKTASYSSSNGCVCISTNQLHYIHERGGNNTTCEK